MEDRGKYFDRVEQIMEDRKEEYELEGYFVRYSMVRSLEGWSRRSKKRCPAP